MSFANLKRGNDVAQSTDATGSYILDSNVYEATVMQAYIDEFRSGAQFVNLKLRVNKGDGAMQEYNERLTITNKNGDIFYTSRDGKKRALPGYDMIDDLCWLINGKDLSDTAEEGQDATVKVWDAQSHGEVPATKRCLTGIQGETVLVAILKVRRNKQVQDESGAYVDSKDEQIINSIRKFFDPETKATVPELRKAEAAGLEATDVKPRAMEAWLERNQNVTRDEYKSVVNAPRTVSGNTGAKAHPTLFGKKS